MDSKDISELQVSSIIGKTIRAVTISDNSTRLVFTDGGTMEIWGVYGCYEGELMTQIDEGVKLLLNKSCEE